jgi:hypothetical protein
MSVASNKTDKADKYIIKYDNMKQQLDDIDNKLERLTDTMNNIVTTFNGKRDKEKEKYDSKMAYYKKCIEETKNKYKKDMEELVEKSTDKETVMNKEIEKATDYKKVIENNIKKLVKKAKEDNVNLE